MNKVIIRFTVALMLLSLYNQWLFLKTQSNYEANFTQLKLLRKILMASSVLAVKPIYKELHKKDIGTRLILYNSITSLVQ